MASPRLDAQCRDAVELARTAAADLAGPEAVGDHLGVVADGDRVATHSFACLLPAYPGWRVAVVVVRASRAKVVTVTEVALLPGADAIVAPAWVPWSQRVRAGDLGVGDILPPAPDDVRLEPGWAVAEPAGSLAEPGVDPVADDPDLGDVAADLGLARERVLSVDGRDATAERWLSGPHGPDAAMAQAAPAPCSTCGFMVPVTGTLGRLFGVCANEYSPGDGAVVAYGYGCGAHSGAAAPTEGGEAGEGAGVLGAIVAVNTAPSGAPRPAPLVFD